MDTAAALARLRSDDHEQQNAAFSELMAASNPEVPWVYELWGDVVGLLSHPSNRVRAISAQVLSNLVKSDREQRILGDFDRLLNVTRDERFVTARHAMQSLWKVGVAGDAQRRRLLDGLELRYRECTAEKNCTLIRYDIVEVLRKVFDGTRDEEVRKKALAWIEMEEDPKYRKKYARLWPEKL
jgi:hypothetical protein